MTEDALEQSLIKVAQDTSLRYAFYSDLGNTEVYALLMTELPQGKTVVKKNTAIQLQELNYEGRQYVPIFSTLAKLQDFMKKDCRYIGVKGRDLVSMVQERELFLNPGSHYSKIINRKEMGYMNSGAPSEEPQEIVKKPTLLKRMFGGKK